VAELWTFYLSRSPKPTRELQRLISVSQNWDNAAVRQALAEGEKPLHWVSSSKRDFLGFPAPVKDHGKRPRDCAVRLLEIVESHDGNAYRAVYTVRFEKAIYVLHAFQKKSRHGIRTAKRDVDLVAERLKAAKKDYEEHYGKPKR